MRAILALITMVVILSGCNNDDSSDSDNYEDHPSNYIVDTVQYKTINGVDPNLLSLDIYYFGQTTPNTPIVIWVHGGGWITGDKSNQLSNKLKLFASLGYLFVSVNYRLSPSTKPPDPNRIMYPIHNYDVADAVKWVFDNITYYGGDNQKIVIMGHSAGAHLVSLTGTSNNFLPTRGIVLNVIKGIASVDTEGYDVASQAGAGEKFYINAFGTDPDKWEEASPIENLFIGTDYPRFFIAKRGTAARIAIADAFINKLLSVGVLVSQVNGSQYDHDGINNAIGAPNETAITDPLKTFLSQCFQ